MSDYPEHDKMSAVTADSRVIGEFLDTLQGQGISLGHWVPGIFSDEAFVPLGKTIEQVLADYYGIDLKAITAEKQAMYEALRAQAKAG